MSWKIQVFSKRFTQPNNLILTTLYGPRTYVCSDQEPSTDHLNSLKALHTTINELNNSNSANLKGIVEKELVYLNQVAENYKNLCRKYVENSGSLTAQGVANVYACAQQLEVNADWLDKYVYASIPNHLRNMSKANLEDVQQGLQQYHPGSELSALVQKFKQQKQITSEQTEYVSRSYNEIGQFQYSKKRSQNILVNLLHKNGSSAEYHVRKSIQYVEDVFSSIKKKPFGYILHE